MVEAFEGSQGYKLSFKKELVEVEIPKLKKKIDETRRLFDETRRLLEEEEKKAKEEEAKAEKAKEEVSIDAAVATSILMVLFIFVVIGLAMTLVRG